MHTTNYENTLIEIAEDCPAAFGEEPPIRGGKKSVAYLQYEMLVDDPYKYTSDEVLFAVFAGRKEIDEKEWERERQAFFSKGQPCFRASPLTKRYGWGVHSDAQGRVAIYGADSEEYRRLQKDKTVAKTKAMRNKRHS